MEEKKIQNTTELDVTSMVDSLVKNAEKALDEYMTLDQETIDKIVKAMALAGLDKHMHPAKMAIEETGRGIL